MNKIYFDKTEKGREEIVSRTYHLSAKLRPLLVIIDGKHTVEELLKSVQGLGLSQVHLDNLLAEGFIVARPANATAAPATAATTDQTPINANPINLAPPKQAIPLTPEQSAAQLLMIRNFFNENVKSNLGLRGFGMQLKVERAETRDDFLQLREPFLEAVEKAKGEALAKELGNRLDQILQ